MNKELELLLEKSNLFILNGDVIKNTLEYNIKDFRDSDVYKYPLAVDVNNNQVYIYCHKYMIRNVIKIIDLLKQDPTFIVFSAISTKY